jgi:hypothetical protein
VSKPIPFDQIVENIREMHIQGTAHGGSNPDTSEALAKIIPDHM